MAGHLVIVAYRSLVGGVPTGMVDFQVRWFADDDAERIRRLIESEPVESYRNSDQEVVSWELSSILAIEPFEPRESGEEVVGFIASAEKLPGLA